MDSVAPVSFAAARDPSLELVAARIGAATVVVLGEATHGDGATLAAKARLIEYLHERHGFDVLVFEAGLWDCEQMQRSLSEGVAVDRAASVGLYSNAARSEEVREMLGYAQRTALSARPLLVSGIDPQFSGESRGAEYVSWVIERFDGVDGTLLDEGTRAGLRRAFERFPKVRRFRLLSVEERAEDRAVFARVRATLAANRGRFDQVHGAANAALIERSLLDVEAVYDWHRDVRADVSIEIPWNERPEVNNVRDAAMGANLVWLARERFRGRKIIVTMASFHAMREPRSVAGGRFSRFHSAIEHASRELGASLFVLAFTAHEGATGEPATAPRALPATAATLEARLATRAGDALWVDLQRVSEREYAANFLGFEAMRAPWSRQYDGAIVFDRMWPARAANGGTVFKSSFVALLPVNSAAKRARRAQQMNL